MIYINGNVMNLKQTLVKLAGHQYKAANSPDKCLYKENGLLFPGTT
uniref:Uncharacterized protein n=1 Tax=Arundo donax TaxID=35708 RepID=A0A0A8XQY9_ARUDO